MIKLILFELENLLRRKSVIITSALYLLYFYLLGVFLGSFRLFISHASISLPFLYFGNFLTTAPLLVLIVSCGSFSDEFEKRINMPYLLFSRREIYIGKLAAHLIFNLTIVLISFSWGYLSALRLVLNLYTTLVFISFLIVFVIFLVSLAVFTSIVSRRNMLSIALYFSAYIILVFFDNLFRRFYREGLWLLPNELARSIIGSLAFANLSEVPLRLLILLGYSIILILISWFILERIDIR